MIASAPGKLILSGEYAVIFEKPALVMAVNRRARAEVKLSSIPLIDFQLVDLNVREKIALETLYVLYRKIKDNYYDFLNKHKSIKAVLGRPSELIFYSFIHAIEKFKVKIPGGLTITVSSDIPIGCGMGSSAASSLSVLRALAGFFNLDFILNRFYRYLLEIEQIQHGFPSGVDPYISLHGGFIRFQKKKVTQLLKPDIEFYLVNTGKPAANTGECVSDVKKRFEGSSIWDEFEEVTNQIQKAIYRKDHSDLKKLIRKNHRLLVQIGVVPHRVQEFISEIEALGGAAKISGAGSIHGDSAGMVIVLHDFPPEKTIRKYGYELIPIQCEERGAILD